MAGVIEQDVGVNLLAQLLLVRCVCVVEKQSPLARCPASGRRCEGVICAGGAHRKRSLAHAGADGSGVLVIGEVAHDRRAAAPIFTLHCIWIHNKATGAVKDQPLKPATGRKYRVVVVDRSEGARRPANNNNNNGKQYESQRQESRREAAAVVANKNNNNNRNNNNNSEEKKKADNKTRVRRLHKREE